MSRHWNPKEAIARSTDERAKARWPEGATAGLMLVAAGCLGVALMLYRVAGPRDVFGP